MIAKAAVGGPKIEWHNFTQLHRGALRPAMLSSQRRRLLRGSPESVRRARPPRRRP
jgi:hypothetical protein